jgi:hypothetical protein
MSSENLEFVVSERSFDRKRRVAEFHYELGDDHFIETLRFNVLTSRTVDQQRLDAALDLAHVLIGTSYYKLRAPGRIRVAQPLTDAQMAVVEAAYDLGLREFAAVNSLRVPHDVRWYVSARGSVNGTCRPGGRVPLLPIGGGKDSALSMAAIPEATALAINPTDAQQRVASVGAMPLLSVQRLLDPLLVERTRDGGLNGHVPVTAINSAVATLTAVLGGYDPVVFANERSADEDTVLIDRVPVNHQYSKSFHFEHLFAIAARELDITYFSLTRQLSELATVSAVAALPELRSAILSCNRAYTLDRQSDLNVGPQRWCLECGKCCFTFLCFAVFLSPKDAVRMFGGNPLDKVSLIEVFTALWGAQKPFDCVGERAESAAAMAHLATTTAWGSFPVVRKLGSEARHEAQRFGATIESLMTPRGPHLVPDFYVKRLIALLGASQPPIH